MKIRLKTAIVIALVAGMVFSTCLMAQARGPVLTDPAQQAYEYAKKMSLSPTAIISVQNEYEMFKSLQAESYDSLIAMGLTDSEVDAVKGLDYANLIRERRQTYSDRGLRGLGYTDEQIKIMNNFAGTDEEMLVIASNFYWSTSPWSRQAYNISEFHMFFYWEWSSKPLVWLPGRHHMLAFAFDDPRLLVHQTNQHMSVRYVCSAGLAPDIYRVAQFSNNPLSTIGLKFDAQIEGAPGWLEQWAQAGSGEIELYSQEQVNSFKIATKYAASTYGASDIGITWGWPTFTFTPSSTTLFDTVLNWSIIGNHPLP